jgi:hypothetical protein
MAKNKLQEIVMAFAMNKSNKSPKRYFNISDTTTIKKPVSKPKRTLDPGFSVTPPDTYNLRKRGIINDPGFTAKPSGYKGKAMKTGGSTPAWTRKEGKNPTGGLNAKGVASYRRENPGSKLKTAVTTKPSKLKAGSKDAKRRKSFCTRMSGVKGPMKDEKGRPTRKALSLRKWNC